MTGSICPDRVENLVSVDIQKLDNDFRRRGVCQGTVNPARLEQEAKREMTASAAAILL